MEANKIQTYEALVTGETQKEGKSSPLITSGQERPHVYLYVCVCAAYNIYIYIYIAAIDVLTQDRRKSPANLLPAAV